MIVTCENCQSKFRLDDERVKATGSKVRCSKCGHIFKAFPELVEPVEQDFVFSAENQLPPEPVEDFVFSVENQLPPEPVVESEEPEKDVVAEEQEMPPDTGGGEEDLGFDFLEEQGLEEETPSEESLDFDLGDIELEPGEGEFVVAEEAIVPEAISEEELVDLGVEESFELKLEDLTVEDEEDIPAEEAILPEAIPVEEEVEKTEFLPEDISFEEPEATDEFLNLMSEEEGAESSEEQAEEITVDEEIDLNLLDDGAMAIDTEDQELAPDKEDEEALPLVSEEEDITLEDITLEDITLEDITLEDSSDEEAGADDVALASQWEEEEENASTEMKAMEEISFDEESEQFDDGETEFSEEVFAPDQATFRKKKRSSPALLILLIAISIAGGTYAAITFWGPLKSGFKIPYSFKIPYLNITIGGEKSEQVDAGNLKIALLNVKGDFEDNKEAGTLFIIQGHVRNDYSKDRSFVQVKGVLHDKSGKMVKAKSVYCGNIFTRTELEDLPVAEINKKLLIQSGMNQSNVKISPTKMVPFMMVFETLPDDLGEFSVEVSGSAAG